MKHRRVVTTPEADADAQRIDEWWIQHRGAAPNLFVEELADAIALLGVEAGVGVRFHTPPFQASGEPCSGRRAITYHLYFVHTDDLVVIIAIWGATRGTTPAFGDRAASARRALAASDSSAKKPGS